MTVFTIIVINLLTHEMQMIKLFLFRRALGDSHTQGAVAGPSPLLDVPVPPPGSSRTVLLHSVLLRCTGPSPAPPKPDLPRPPFCLFLWKEGRRGKKNPNNHPKTHATADKQWVPGAQRVGRAQLRGQGCGVQHHLPQRSPRSRTSQLEPWSRPQRKGTGTHPALGAIRASAGGKAHLRFCLCARGKAPLWHDTPWGCSEPCLPR